MRYGSQPAADRRRPAYSLLEVLVATGVGVMLMGALIWIFLINPEKSVIDGGLVKSERASA